MRAPAQTLEKLAEVAPKEWRMNYASGLIEWYRNETIVVGELARYDFDDIANGAFIAWCKKQLRERGWRIAIDWQTRCDVVAMHADDPDTYVASLCPTEWQAVAECLIQVLEKGNA